MEPESPLGRELASTLTTLASQASDPTASISDYMGLMQEYRSAAREMTTKLEILDEDARVRLQHNPIHNISSRIKTPTSIVEKLRRKGHPISVESIRANILDVAGVRVVCNYLNDIEEVAGALLAQDDVTLLCRKDYVRHPKESGYRSLHLVVSVPVFMNGMRRDVPVEVQVRTIAMDFWASLEHRLRYKNREVLEANEPEVETIRRRLTDCASAIASIDEAMQEIQGDIDTLKAERDEAIDSAPQAVSEGADRLAGPREDSGR